MGDVTAAVYLGYCLVLSMLMSMLSIIKSELTNREIPLKAGL